MDSSKLSKLSWAELLALRAKAGQGGLEEVVQLLKKKGTPK